MMTFIICSTLILWISFIALTKIVDMAKDEWETINWLKKLAVIAFVIIDVLHNYTAGAIIFMELASNDRKTLTARMREVLKRDNTEFLDQCWRKPIATFICKYMVEPWDFGHCGLGE